MACPTTSEQQEELKCPSKISSHSWEKFQLLKEKRKEVTKKGRERKLRQMKKTQDEHKEELQKEKQKEEEEEAARKLKENDRVKVYTASTEPASEEDHNGSSSTKSQRNWDGIRGFLDCNSHLGEDHVRHKAKSGLEKKIDEAIEKGDFSTAEELSDQLATREFGKKISDAIDARDFTAKRKQEEEILTKKKKKKLHWGFEHKERWEMKANM